MAFVVLVLACAPKAGPLLASFVAYGLALTAMAVLSTGLNRATALGGAIFMVSDSLIALGAFRDWSGRPLSVAIMATYAVAQLLLVLGIQGFRRRQPQSCRPTSGSSSRSDRSTATSWTSTGRGS